MENKLHVVEDWGLFLKAAIFIVPRMQSGPYLALIKYLLDEDDMFDDKDENKYIATASTTLVITSFLGGETNVPEYLLRQSGKQKEADSLNFSLSDAIR